MPTIVRDRDSSDYAKIQTDMNIYFEGGSKAVVVSFLTIFEQ